MSIAWGILMGTQLLVRLVILGLYVSVAGIGLVLAAAGGDPVIWFPLLAGGSVAMVCAAAWSIGDLAVRSPARAAGDGTPDAGPDREGA